MNAAVPFKFRYVREIVGTFVLLAVAAVVAGLILLARAQRWFEPQLELRLAFPPEGTFGVQRGTRVEILGAPAGRVESVHVRPDRTIEGRLVLRRDFAAFLRADSEAVVKKEYGVAGAAFISIALGQGPPLSAENATLPVRKDTELLEIVQIVVEQIQEAVLPVLREVEATLKEYRGLAADLRDPDHSLQQLLGQLNAIADGLRKGEGTAGRLLRDPALADEAQKAVAQLRSLIGKVEEAVTETRGILHNVRMASEGLPGAMATVQGELRDVPGLVLQTRATLQETERLLAGLQRHWLLRGAMEPAADLPTVPAAAPASGEAP